MCGIVGVWHTNKKPVNAEFMHNAVQTIFHRGPDDAGFMWAEPMAQYWREGEVPPADWIPSLALGFRRLAILDLSRNGHQPMSYAEGRYWLVFNGEIYNYLEIRNLLTSKGYIFKSNTDTEVVLAAYIEWGEDCVTHFNGMWAFTLWDVKECKLFCSRDRLGIKPFYYAWDGSTFHFGSEIKAILELSRMPRYPDDPSLFDFLAYGLTDHNSSTFFEGVNQLPPAHNLTVRPNNIRTRCYWELDPKRHEYAPSGEVYSQRFSDLFVDAIRLHLRSDVAVGTCLSGGLDSSSIVCTANRLLLQEKIIPSDLVGAQQKTFSACFAEPSLDERPYMRAVLDATHAEQNFVFPSLDKLFQDLERLLWHQEQPFGGSGVFAQWCVMEQAAKRGVRVILDGQGGDELLGGYDSHRDFYFGMQAQRGNFIRLMKDFSDYRRLHGLTWPMFGLGLMRGFVPEPLMNLARNRRKAGVSTQLGLSREFRQRHSNRVNLREKWGDDVFSTWSYYVLTKGILPTLLRYEDRNSMAHSIEARVPFLDYRLVEFSMSLPVEQKIYGAVSKVILRNAMKGVLPETVRTRLGKLGYSTPEHVWFNGALGNFLREVSESSSFRERGYWDVSVVQTALKEHQQNRRNLAGVGWRWLNVELWMRQFIDNFPRSPIAPSSK